MAVSPETKIPNFGIFVSGFTTGFDIILRTKHFPSSFYCTGVAFNKPTLGLPNNIRKELAIEPLALATTILIMFTRTGK